MRKIKVVGALLLILTFSAIAVTSAFAADEWLVGGNLIVLGGSFPAVTKGTWLLLALSFGGFVKTHIVCNAESLGTVNGLNASGKGTDTVTEIHNLSLTQLKKITCEVLASEKGACSTTLALLTAINLPWLSELVLKTGDTKPRDLFSSGGSGEPGFRIECVTGTGTFEETCEGNVETEQLSNTAKGVSGEIKNLLSSKCGVSGDVGHIYGTGEVTEPNGSDLAVG
ncbi:MAG TPA: hypothetical protein VGY30_12470 [Solirubrobacteraceae bacterium]|jgi:hypothetical protein|nr:hypothetical protein [Solirubrobacteraceae bacterium]